MPQTIPNPLPSEETPPTEETPPERKAVAGALITQLLQKDRKKFIGKEEGEMFLYTPYMEQETAVRTTSHDLAAERKDRQDTAPKSAQHKRVNRQYKIGPRPLQKEQPGRQ